jgi:hypothetical protein
MQRVRGRRRPMTGGRRAAAVAAVVATGALCAGGGIASAAVGPQGIRPGHNITVFHNIDFVAAFGHGAGEDVQVDLVRGAHRVATARGFAVPLGAPEGGALEVNHGPAGLPRPGDCFEGATPDVHPGDLVRVTSAGGVDEVIVDDVSIDSVTRTLGANGIKDDDDEIWVEGNARSGLDGSALDVAMLDSGEFRDPANGKLRIDAPEVVAGSTPGRYIAKYRAPLHFVKDAVPTLTALAALERDGHAFGYGHALLPDGTLRPDAMLAEGTGEHNGPALGCEAIAPAEASSAGTTSVETLNATRMNALADRDVALSVGGWAAAGIESAEVELRGPAGTAAVKAVDGLAAGATAQQGWGVAFTKAEVAALGEGTLAARLRVGGAPVGATKSVLLDTVAPGVPTAAPGPGAFVGAQRVNLAAEAGATIHYTTDGSEPTTASARFGAPIRVDSDATIRAIAVDAAGNVSGAAAFEFTILAPPAASAAPATAVPGAGVIAPAGAPATPAAPATTPAVTLRVRRLSAPRRLSAARARRAGLVAAFVTPAGAVAAEARLYRLAGARRRLVATRIIAATPGRRQVARFTTASIRRKLAAGPYVLEVRTGPSPGRLGPATTLRLRIAR